MENAFSSTRNKYERVVLLVDMDCFYCQVEEILNPALKGRPLAVVQYNAWRGGGIIAVNYAARAKGVTRHMRGDEAKVTCPEIELVHVPSVREKADLSKYRDAGKDVAKVLQKFTTLLERASVDEAYLDITHLVNDRLDKLNSGSFILQPAELLNTFAVGYDNIGEYVHEITTRLSDRPNLSNLQHYNFTSEDKIAVEKLDIRLLIGASVANEIRAAVKQETAYECSAGISFNKIVAKLACGINKPNKQTILPLSQIPKFFETLPLCKIKGLGGKFGEEVCERFGIKFLGELCQYTEEQLQRKFDEKSGTWLYGICRGVECEPVTSRFYSKSIGCCKRFPGRNCITGLDTLQHWLNELTAEISDRLDKDMSENNRRAKQMVVSYTQEFDGEDVQSSRSININNYDQAYLTRIALDVLKANTKQFLLAENDKKLNNAIKFLGISVGKFETAIRGQCSVQEMFALQTAKKRKSSEAADALKSADLKETVVIDNQEENEMQQLELPENLKATKSVENINNKNQQNTDDVTSEKKLKCSFLVNYLQNKNNAQTKTKIPEKSIELAAEKQQENNSNEETNTKSSPAEVEHHVAATSENKSNKEYCIENFFKKTSIQQIEQQTSKRRADENDQILSETVEDNLPNKRSKLTEVQMENTEKNNTFDYQSTYAEFAMPALNEACFNFITCEECNKRILADEISVQTHRDEHFAFKLSQQIKEEFKSTQNNQNKILPARGNKQQQNKTKPTTSSTNITKFLTSTQTIVADSTADTQLCEKCNKIIAKSALAEHLDYHMAKEIMEKEKLELRSGQVNNQKINESIKSARTKSAKTSSNSAVNTISKFFTKPNC